VIVTAPLRLMAVLAHPDDESLGLGGILAKYSAEGVEASLVTATRGQSGRFLEHRSGPEHPGPEKLGIIREAELRCAAQTLGVRDVHVLGHMDGALDQADPRRIVAEIAAHLRRARPQVVVTFPADGAYGHPDHIAISQFTTAAIVAAADPKFRLDGAAAAHQPHAISKLYFIAVPRREWEIYQGVFKKLVSLVDGVEREAVPWQDWAITTIVDTSAHWQQVWKAVECHQSQMASYAGLADLSPETHQFLWGHQHFYRALSLVNGGRKRESDLFEGLR
jgi:LmbE family N-acetylglucosaminyl deacetylase